MKPTTTISIRPIAAAFLCCACAFVCYPLFAADPPAPDKQEPLTPVEPKVTICHKGNTLSVALAAVDAHLKHGDTLGACATNAPSVATNAPAK